MQNRSDSPSYVPGTGRTTSSWKLFTLLSPALFIILLLFGGGLVLGLLQSLGHLPSEGFSSINLEHFRNVLRSPDFVKSLLLTLYISFTSTLIAALISVPLALTLMRWAASSRAVTFVLQIPLTVPHLVIAISTILLLAPSGLVSRFCSFLGITTGPSSFPLLINDEFGIGILAVYIWKEVPFITFMLLAVLRNMGYELLEAGSTLKASRFQRFRYITLPIISPSLGAACLIVFAFTFGAFEVPYLLGQTYPMVLPVWAYKNFSDIDLLARPEGIAIGLLIAATIILSILFSQLLIHLGRRRGLRI